MDLDPSLQSLSLRLAEFALRNTAGEIADRISQIRARRKTEETVNALEEIINELVTDKNELRQIAAAFEAELVAQRISDGDIEFITTHMLPKLEELFEQVSDASGADQLHEMMSVLKPLLSKEVVNILQLLGFNFRRAIGEPLTQLLARMIESASPPRTEDKAKLQMISQEFQLAAVQLARDPEATARFKELRKTD